VIVTYFEFNNTHRYAFSGEQLVRPPRAAESQGWQDEQFKNKILICCTNKMLNYLTK